MELICSTARQALSGAEAEVAENVGRAQAAQRLLFVLRDW
jgi:hypothetical protein